MRRLCIGGSLIGGIKETQDMLNLCGEKGITCDVEVRCVSFGLHQVSVAGGFIVNNRDACVGLYPEHPGVEK